jgi:O-methyltransferase
MPSWIINTFYNVVDGTRFARGLTDIRGSIEGGDQGGVFVGDNLIAWGRNLSFFDDQIFMNAFLGSNPDRVEKSLVWRKYILTWAARRALTLPEGDLVEAGCYKGSSARVVCDATDLKRQPHRTYWLYDAFEEVDPGHRLPDHSPELEQQVRQRFSDMSNVRIIAGRVPDSFDRGEPERIALLHIDMNSVEPESRTLERFYDRVVPGGMILFDDYGAGGFREQKLAHDAYMAQRGQMILELPSYQGLFIR